MAKSKAINSIPKDYEIPETSDMDIASMLKPESDAMVSNKNKSKDMLDKSTSEPKIEEEFVEPTEEENIDLENNEEVEEENDPDTEKAIDIAVQLQVAKAISENQTAKVATILKRIFSGEKNKQKNTII